MCAIKEVRIVSDDQNSRESLKQLNQVFHLHTLQLTLVAFILFSLFFFFPLLAYELEYLISSKFWLTFTFAFTGN